MRFNGVLLKRLSSKDNDFGFNAAYIHQGEKMIFIFSVSGIMPFRFCAWSAREDVLSIKEIEAGF